MSSALLEARARHPPQMISELQACVTPKKVCRTRSLNAVGPDSRDWREFLAPEVRAVPEHCTFNGQMGRIRDAKALTWALLSPATVRIQKIGEKSLERPCKCSVGKIRRRLLNRLDRGGRMKKLLVVFAMSVSLMSMVAFAQSLQAVVGISNSTTNLCEDIENSTTRVTASASCGWNDGLGDFAAGNGTSTASYGVLQSFATISQTIASGTAQTDTGTQTGGVFQDSFTFPSLSTNAFLQATLSVSGSESLSGDGYAAVSADVYLNGSSNCVLQVLTGSCTTSFPISPGTQVSVQGSLGTEPAAGPGPGSGSATLNFDGKKSFGAHYAFAVVDSAGKPMNVKIVAASGTKYPTK